MKKDIGVVWIFHRGHDIGYSRVGYICSAVFLLYQLPVLFRQFGKVSSNELSQRAVV